MSLSPQVCKKSYKVKIPTLGENCESWLITVTDESGITNPNKDHAYLTDSGKLYIYNGKTLIQVNCDICFTQEERDKLEGIEEGANKYVLPVATDNALGGIKTGFTQTEKQYAVEVTEEESGYMPPLSGNSNEFLNGNGEWSVPSGYSLPQATTTVLGGVKIGSNITVSSGTISLTKANVVSALGYTPPTTNTTYSLATTSASGLLRQLNGNTSQFLNGNGQWATPPNTTYGVATTSSNGLMSSTDKSRLDQLWAKFDSMVFFTED